MIGIANDYIRSYLSDRQQFVTFNGIRSSQRNVDISVPQDSNIGPLLLLVFINHLGNLKLRAQITRNRITINEQSSLFIQIVLLSHYMVDEIV